MDQATYDRIFNETLARATQAKQPKPKQPSGTFDAGAFLDEYGITPPQSGLISGTARGLARGAGGAISQFGKALEYDSDQNQGFVNRFGSTVDEAGQYLTNLIDKPVAERGSTREALFNAAESALPSIATAAPAIIGGALGSLAGPVGTAVGAGLGAALSYPVMHQASAQDAYETLQKTRQELSESEKRRIASSSGIWEATPEALGNVAEGVIMSAIPGGKAVKTLADVAKATFKPGVKQIAKSAVKSLPIEMGTEAITGYGQTKLLQDAGVTDESPFAGAIQGAKTTAFMTPMIALFGGSVNNIKARILENAITKPIPKQGDVFSPSHLSMRESAVNTLDSNIAKTVDPDTYTKVWQPIKTQILASPNQGFDINKLFSTGVVGSDVTTTPNAVSDTTTEVSLTTAPTTQPKTSVKPRQVIQTSEPIEGLTPVSVMDLDGVKKYTYLKQDEPVSSFTEDVDEIFPPTPEAPNLGKIGNAEEAGVNIDDLVDQTNPIEYPGFLGAMQELNDEIPNMELKEYLDARKNIYDHFGITEQYSPEEALNDFNANLQALNLAPVETLPQEAPTTITEEKKPATEAVKATEEAIIEAPITKPVAKAKVKKVAPVQTPIVEAVTEQPQAAPVDIAQEAEEVLAQEEVKPTTPKRIIRKAKPKGEVNVKENVTGIPSGEQNGQKPKQAKPIKRTGKEEVGTGRDVQTYEEERPRLTDAVEKAKQKEEAKQNVIKRYAELIKETDSKGLSKKKYGSNRDEIITLEKMWNDEGLDLEDLQKAAIQYNRDYETSDTKLNDVRERFEKFTATSKDTTLPPIKRKAQEDLAQAAAKEWVKLGGKLEDLVSKETSAKSEGKSVNDQIKSLKEQQEALRDKLVSLKDRKSSQADTLRTQIAELEDQIDDLDEDASEFDEDSPMKGLNYKVTDKEQYRKLNTLEKAFAHFELFVDKSSPYRVIINRLRQMGMGNVPVQFTDTPIQLAGGDPSKKAAGVYRSSSGRIAVYLRDAPLKTLKTLIHEAIHAATSSKLKNAEQNPTVSRYKDAANNMLDLYNDVMAVAKEYNLKDYGFTNVREFVAEGFTNKQFQEVLKGIPVKKEYSDKTYKYSMWDRFVGAIAKFLNIKSTDDITMTALGQFISVGNTLLSDEYSGGPDVFSDNFLLENSEDMLSQFEDYRQDFVEKGKKAITSPTAMITEVSNAIGEHAPSVKKYLRNLMVMPFFYAERLIEKNRPLGMAVAKMVKASENKTAYYNQVFERLVTGDGNTKGFAEIRDMVDSLSQKDALTFQALNVFGDMENKEYMNIGEVPKNEYIGTVSKPAFEAYRALRDFSNKVFDQAQDEILKTAIFKYKPTLQVKLKKLMTELHPGTSFSKHLIKSKLDSILNSDEASNKELVKNMVDDILESKMAVQRIKMQIGKIKGYMPRIRKQGQYKLTILDDEGNRLYMNTYSTPFQRNLDRKAIEANPKDKLALNYKGGPLDIKEEYIQKNQYQKLGTTPTASELHLEQALNKALARKEITEKQFGVIKKNIAMRTAEVVLGDSAGRHRINRVKEYIEGYETDPMKAFEVMVENMSRSIAKSRYITEQHANYKEVVSKDPEKQVSEYMMDYLISTMKPKELADNLSAKTRYLTTLYFLGGNIGAAAINSLQNMIIGIPELSRYTSTTNAAKLLNKYMFMVVPESISHQTGKTFSRTAEGRIAPVSKSLPIVLQDMLKQYRTSGLNFDTQTALQSGTSDEVYGTQAWNTLRKVGDAVMLPFKAVEAANREAALLAYMDMKLTKEGINPNNTKYDPDKVDEIYKEAVNFVNTVHFMGSGNLPVFLQKSAIARTALAMQSYGLNFWNLIYNRMTSKDKEQFNAGIKTFAILGALGGAAGAVPFSDEMNKILKWLLGRDLKQESIKAVGRMTGDDFANLMAYGLPTIFGANISNNVNLRLPVISGLLGGSDLGIAAGGAPASVIMRQAKALNYITNGQWGKAFGIGSPEALGRAFRAYSEYNKGFTSTKGTPAMYKGEPLKSSMLEAIIKGTTGFRSNREVQIADVRFSEFEVKQKWQNKKTVAINNFIAGDKGAINDFNESLRSKGAVAKLISPIKGSDILKARNRKQEKRSVAYEKELEV